MLRILWLYTNYSLPKLVQHVCWLRVNKDEMRWAAVHLLTFPTEVSDMLPRRPLLKRWYKNSNKSLKILACVALQYIPARRSKRGTCYSSACLAGYVPLSVTRRYCIKTAKSIWLLWNVNRNLGSHGCRIEWYNFRWPWVTPTRVSRSLCT